MIIKRIIFILFLILSVSPVFAEHNGFEGHDHASKPRSDNPADNIDVTVLPGEAVIIVHGIVCSFCSQGVTRNLSRLPFIDQSRYTKGVKVEIEVQKVTIAVKPDSKLDLAQVFKSILDGGYDPIEAYVRDSEGNISLHKADGV